MATKNIVIAPCGNKAVLFRDGWLKYKEEKEFDLCLLFYHEEINDPSRYAGVDYFFHLKDFKWIMIHELFTRIKPEWLEQYEYFYFLDDDIEMDTRGINDLFRLSAAFHSQVSCAALTRDSFCSWKMFRRQSNSFCRYVGQIEVMAPLFHRDALKTCLPSFNANKSSWGLDSVWSKLLGYPKDKLMVFDTVLMRHTQPVGGGELYRKLGVDPHKEWKDIIDQYGARKHNYQEYGRLQLVDAQHNKLQFLYYKLREFMNKKTQAVRDYDLPSRVVNRTNKLRGKKLTS